MEALTTREYDFPAEAEARLKAYAASRAAAKGQRRAGPVKLLNTDITPEGALVREYRVSGEAAFIVTTAHKALLYTTY